MCKEGFVCLPENTCKPLRLRITNPTEKTSSVENIIIDEKLHIDESIRIELIIIDDVINRVTVIRIYCGAQSVAISSSINEKKHGYSDDTSFRTEQYNKYS
jgi:hypothetical protein